MQPQPGTLKQMQFIFIAIAIGPLVLLAATIFIMIGNQEVVTDYNHPLIYVTAAVTTVLLSASILIYKLKLPAIKEKASLKEKFMAWKSLYIMKLAMVETACFFNIICLFITTYDLFLYLAVAVIAYQLINFPARNKVIEELALNEEEITGL